MIRPYKNNDRDELISLLRLNIPKYFDPSEEIEFIDYLDHKLEDYFVVESDHKIIGSGGVNYLLNKSEARISWDIIHPDFQGQGIGKKLTQYRIDHIRKNKTVYKIVVRTSQLAYKFYEKMGFTLEKIEKDFWAKDFDLYEMVIDSRQK